MISQNYLQNKTWPSKGILLNGVLIPKLLNNPFAFCFLINFDSLLSHIAQFDNIIVLLLMVHEIFGFMFSVFFYTLNNKKTLFYNYEFCLIISSMPFLLPSSIKFFFSVSIL